MNTFTDMMIWKRALNMAVSLYQVDAAKSKTPHIANTDEEFGHMFSASLNSVYKDFMLFDIEQLSEEQVQALFLGPEN